MSPEPLKRLDPTDFLNRVAARFNRLAAQGYDSGSKGVKFLGVAGAVSAVALGAAFLLGSDNDAPPAPTNSISGKVGFQSVRDANGRVIERNLGPEQDAILIDPERQSQIASLFKFIAAADLSPGSVQIIQKQLKGLGLYNGPMHGEMNDRLRDTLVSLIEEDTPLLRQISPEILDDMMQHQQGDTIKSLLLDDQDTWDHLARRIHDNHKNKIVRTHQDKVAFQAIATALGLYSGAINGIDNDATLHAKGALEYYFKNNDKRAVERVQQQAKTIEIPDIPSARQQSYSVAIPRSAPVTRPRSTPPAPAPVRSHPEAPRTLIEHPGFMQALLSGNHNRARIHMERLDTAPLILRAPTRGRVSDTFGLRARHPVHGGGPVLHLGIDIAAKQGTPIFPAAAGRVIRAENYRGYGRTVILDHGRGVYSLYAHMHNIHVRKGDHVNAGEKIGTVGSTGWSTGPHLHLEFAMMDAKGVLRKVDPELVLNKDMAHRSTREKAIADSLAMVSRKKFALSNTEARLVAQAARDDNIMSAPLARAVHNVLRHDPALSQSLPAATLRDLERHGYGTGGVYTASIKPR